MALKIDGIEESAWQWECGPPEWSQEHVLLAPYDPEGGLISFAKPLNDPLRAWGVTARTHQALVGNWFPLERFFRTDLLESRFGQLADGPARLLEPYADALRSVGEDVSFARIDQSWRAKNPTPTVVNWGNSYFVASSFRLERTG